MNTDERIAQNYLKNLNMGPVTFEPDGNCPPDFLLNHKIAIEVRRLNKGYFKDGKRRGLEEDEQPVWQAIKKVCQTFGPSNGIKSWFLIIQMQKPIGTIGDIRKEIDSFLTEFVSSRFSGCSKLHGKNGISVSLVEGGKSNNTLFCMGGSTNLDAGGFVVPDLFDAVTYCSNEKENKVAPYRKNYSVWWLYLVDHISLGEGIEELKNHYVKSSSWDKILVGNPNNSMTIEI